MISWASKKLLNAGLAIALLATLSTVGFFNAPVSADAVDGEKGIANYSERWLRYRAIAACFSAQDVGGNSYDKVTGGTFLQRGTLADWKTTIGYLNSDGKVSCGDGSMVTNSMKTIGFSDTLNAFCSMSTAERDGKKDFANCVGGSGEFDMDGSRDDQYEAFKSAKAAKVADSAEFPHSTTDEKTKPILYWVGRESLVTFCGGKRGEKYDDSMAGNIRDSKRKVVVNDINLGTGEVERYVYNLDRDEGDTINNVWAEKGQDNSTDYAGDSVVMTKDMSCAALAQMTWEYDTAFGAFVTRYNIANPEDAGTGNPEDDKEGSNEPVCSAGALGWVICPAINFIADINDAVYDVVENMLYINPVTVETNGPLYQTWTKFRDLANILFVIVFMVVIFSQATSVGISSYGIKRLLPRIFAAAVLVNISFFICQIAIDVSNIIGIGVTDFVGELHSGSTLDINQLSWSTVFTAALGGGAAVLGVGAILGAGSVTAAIAMLLPFAVTALFAVITALVVLIARQVLIILLVALAPLAFIATILPNTQKYFQLWQNSFTTLLVMFPLVALLFAGSQLAANIVLTSPTGEDGISYFSLIAAIAMLFIPLFGVPYIVKFSGGTLGRIAGFVNNPNKGPLDRARKKASEYSDFKKDRARTGALGVEGRTKNPFVRRTRQVANRDYKYKLAKGIAEEQEQEYIAGRALGQGAAFDPSKVDVTGLSREDAQRKIASESKAAQAREGQRFAQKMAGSDNIQHITAVQASAQATADKLERQSVANREVLLRAKYTPEELIQKATVEFETSANGKDAVGARAAQNILLNSGTPGLESLAKGIDKVEKSGGFDAAVMAGVQKDLNAAGLKPKDNALATWAYKKEGDTIESIRNSASTYSGLNDQELVGQINANLEVAVREKAITVERAQKLLTNQSLQGALTDKKREILSRTQAADPGQPPIPGI